jgi:hypothetical protein
MSEPPLARHWSLVNRHLSLFILSMQPVAAAAATKLFELQSARCVLFVFGRHVIPLFALGALQNYVVSRHKSSL